MSNDGKVQAEPVAKSAFTQYTHRPTRTNAIALIKVMSSWRMMPHSARLCGMTLAIYEVLLERKCAHGFNLLTLFGLRWAKFATGLELKGANNAPLADPRWNDYYVARFKLTRDLFMVDRLHDQIHSPVHDVAEQAKQWCKVWSQNDVEFWNRFDLISQGCGKLSSCRLRDSTSRQG